MNRIYFFLSLISIIVLFSVIKTPLVSAQEASSPSATTYVNYDLAYPGILPDNPLYKLKVLRDKIIALFLASNPQKLINFYLTNTDKGILATAMLVDKNKIQLAQETLLKAENNYTLITFQLGSLPKKPNQAFFDKLETAARKHQEVIASFIKRIPAENQKTFKTVIEFSKRNVQTIEDYRNSE